MCSELSKYPLLQSNFKTDNTQRYNLAWTKARQAAKVLKENYFAKRVILFGSLLHKDLFDLDSDIDLAVCCIPDNKFYEAVGSVMYIVSPFEIDIVDIDDCKETIRKIIESDGIEL